MRMCPYCLIEPATIVADNKLVVAVRNASPLAPLHTLILPRRHVPNYFELYLPEMMGVDEILRQVSEDICASDGTVRGFNIGISVGGAAGQISPALLRRLDSAPPWRSLLVRPAGRCD